MQRGSRSCGPNSSTWVLVIVIGIVIVVVIMTLPLSFEPGGGGFLVALLRDPLDREKAIEAVRKVPATDRVTFHTATVDR